MSVALTDRRLGRSYLGAWLPGGGEFVEGDADPLVRLAVDAEFVVASAQVLPGSERGQLFAREPGQTHVVHGPGALGGEVLTGHDGRDVDHRVHGGGRH